PLYALMMEVALPDGLNAEELDSALARVGGEQGVEVSLRALEQDALYMTDSKPPHPWMPLQIVAGRASSGSSRHLCLNFALRPSLRARRARSLPKATRSSRPQGHADSESIIQSK